MIKMQPVPTEPVDREIEVTVTLKFPESEIRKQADRCGLASWLGGEFNAAIKSTSKADPYPALRKLA
jgi:hypothetical protein